MINGFDEEYISTNYQRNMKDPFHDVNDSNFDHSERIIYFHGECSPELPGKCRNCKKIETKTVTKLVLRLSLDFHVILRLEKSIEALDMKLSIDVLFYF